MKTETVSNNNPTWARNQKTASPDLLDEQCGLGFIARIYRTTLWVWAIVALIVADRFGLASLVGLSLGAALSLGSLRLIEVIVRALVRPEVQIDARQFLLVLLLKFPILTVVMVGVVWSVMAGYTNVFAFVGGIALVHAVIVLKAVGGWLVSSMPAESRLASREVWVSRLFDAARSGGPVAPARPDAGVAPQGARGIARWVERPPVAEPAD